MKKFNTTIKAVIFSAIAATFSYSCSEENVIDLEPYNQLSENSAFATPSAVNLSLNGMYQAAQLGWYDGAPRGYPFGAAYFQQNDMRGEDMVNTAAFYAYTYTSTWDASGTANNIHYWLDSYRLINRANLVIEGVTRAVANNVITKDIGDDYIGQALFFRAMTHLELLKHFSRPYNHTADASHMGVVYRTKGSSSPATIEENSKLGRTSVAENYKQLIDDLNQAETLIKSKSQRGSVKEGIVYATKEAVIAIKTRVYLNMRRWNDVVTEANKLNGIYTLTASPNGPFAGNYANTESIFSLENSATNNPDVNAALASQYLGRQLIAISPIIWNDPMWLKDDKRRTMDEMVKKSGTALYTYKYKDTSTRSDASPLIRYAEILLNRAEAKARLGDATYLADLNAVRSRSLANPATQAYVAFPSAKEAVAAILKEKRIEFLGEGMRWGDIHRLQKDDLVPMDGIPAKYISGAAPKEADYVIGTPYVIKATDLQRIPYSNDKFLWPIPTRETSANPVLAAQQNPGY